MEDYMIVELYWKRAENAISETKLKYERILTGISLSLSSTREAIEKRYRERYEIYLNSCHTHLDGDKTPEEIAERIIEEFFK